MKRGEHTIRTYGGFTLIELMIVVAVVAILAAIAYPSYQDQVRKGRRSDAKVALTDAAQRMERCFTNNNTYTGCAFAAASPEGYYAITNTNASATTYTLTATPQAPQTGDRCGTITLNEQGIVTVSGGTVAECW